MIEPFASQTFTPFWCARTSVDVLGSELVPSLAMRFPSIDGSRANSTEDILASCDKL